MAGFDTSFSSLRGKYMKDHNFKKVVQPVRIKRAELLYNTDEQHPFSYYSFPAT